MPTRRGVLSTVLAASLTVAAAGCAAPQEQTGTEGREIVIGASLELSGPTASIGTTYEKALRLKVAQLNRRGLAGGRTIRLIIRDNQTTPEVNQANIRHFIETDRVSAVISGACSACILPAIDTLNARKVPAIALGSASAITTPRPGEPADARRYLFKVSPNPQEDAKVLMEHVGNDPELKRIGMLNVDNVYGREGRQSITEMARRGNLDVVEQQDFPEGAQDMTAQVERLVAKNPDVIVAWAVMPAAGIIARTVRAAGFTGKLYYDAGAGAELFVQGAGAAAEGAFMVFPEILAINDLIATAPSVIAQKQWFEEYSSTYGAYSGFTSFAADALQLIVDAVASTGSTDPEKIRDGIERSDIAGLSGPIRMSPGNHSGLQPSALAVLVVRKGAWHLAA